MQDRAVLHLTGMGSTKYGGVEHYFIELARLCIQRGYRTVLQYESLPKSHVYLRDLENVGAKVVVSSTRVGFLSLIRLISSLMYAIRPEIIQTHFVNKNVLLVTPFIARILGVKRTIATVHLMYSIKEILQMRFAFNRYNHVLAVSKAVADRLLFGNVKQKLVSTHYLGLIGQRKNSKELRLDYRKEFGIPEHAIVLACIAFDTRIKGIDVLLRAFKKIIHNHPGVRLIVVGIDPHSSTLAEQAAKLGLSTYVHWAGIRDEGWRILNAADIYIQPSRSEAICLSIIEAMSLRLPVIATNTGGIPEVVIHEKTGYLVEPDNADNLAATIEFMLENPGIWKAFGEAGYLRYQHFFSGEKSANILVEDYFGLKH